MSAMSEPMGFHGFLNQTLKNGPLFEITETFRVIGVPVTHARLLLNNLVANRIQRNFKGIPQEDRSKMMADLRTVGLDCSIFGMPPSMEKEKKVDDNLTVLSTIYKRYAPDRDIDPGLRLMKQMLMVM